MKTIKLIITAAVLFAAASALALKTDQFNSSTTDPAWRFVDPVGDCSYSMNGAQAVINVGGGNSHDIWTSGINAPRLLQSAADEDFRVQVKFDSVPSLKYQMQGIVVQANDQQILRFDCYHDGSSPMLFAAYVNADVSSATIYLNSAPSPATVPAYLRVEREGDNWTCKYSHDGTNWTTACAFTRAISVQDIGIYGANHTPNPAFTMQADCFQSGDIHYVAPSGSHNAPYLTWGTAATNIQSAIDAALDGDTVLVTNATYIVDEEISLEKRVLLQSVNGSDVTVIDGSGSTLCVHINNAGAVLDGFTVQNGYNPGGFGGGVEIDTGGTARNCELRNSQARDGAGIAINDDGLVENCYIHDNLAWDNGTRGYGGGVRLLNGGTARGCLIVNNESRYLGGGLNIWNAGAVENCTIVSNTCDNGAGIRTRNKGTVVNTIIYLNNGDDWELSGSGYSYSNCCTPAASSLPGLNNIANLPQFVDSATGDYRLASTSPCIDAGTNMPWMAEAVDLLGEARIAAGQVDIGAYETHLAEILVEADPAEGGSVTGGGSANIGEQVQISADPAEYWQFEDWDDGNTENPRTITVASGGATYTANFSLIDGWRKPDFTVESIEFTSAEIVCGGTFDAEVTVKNQGHLPAAPGRIEAWVNQPSGDITAASGNGGTNDLATLAIGATRTYTFEGLSAPTEDGTYTFRAAADTENSATEESEGNNQKTITYTLHEAEDGDETPAWMKPDFVISEIYFTDVESPASGENFRLRVRIENKGDIAGDGGYVHFWAAPPYDAGTAVISIPVGELEPGQSITRSRLLTAPVEAGTYLACGLVVTDAPEKSTGNNQNTITYTLHEAEDEDETPDWMKPDFIVTDAVLTPQPLRIGESFSAEITVKNQGHRGGDAGELGVWVDNSGGGAVDAAVAIGTLDIGESQTITVNGLVAPQNGWYNLRAEADYAAIVPEMSEGNNNHLETYEVKAIDSTITRVGDDVEIRWESRADEYYNIFCSTNLVVGFELLERHIAATPPENINVHTDAPAGFCIYRVEVEP